MPIDYKKRKNKKMYRIQLSQAYTLYGVKCMLLHFDDNLRGAKCPSQLLIYHLFLISNNYTQSPETILCCSRCPSL